MRRTFLCAIVLVVGGAALAQAPAQRPTPAPAPAAAPAPTPAADPAADPVLGAMAKARFLLGRWEGDGRMRMGPGEPKPTHVTEHVYAKLGGRVIVLEGHGTTPGPEGAPPITVHEAFGVLSYDPGAGAYLLRAFKGDGRFVDADVEAGNERLV